MSVGFRGIHIGARVPNDISRDSKPQPKPELNIFARPETLGFQVHGRRGMVATSQPLASEDRALGLLWLLGFVGFRV